VEPETWFMERGTYEHGPEAWIMENEPEVWFME
jgi:hypothetical protein